MHPEFCGIIFKVHPWFCSLTIQGATSIESTYYEVEYEHVGHVLGHKVGAAWLDPPLGSSDYNFVCTRRRHNNQ